MFSLMEWESEDICLEIQFLSLLEKCTVLNRWLRIEYDFYYADRDALYVIKHQIIQDLVSDGTLTLKRIVKRKNLILEDIRSTSPESMFSNMWFSSEYLPKWFYRLRYVYQQGVEIQVPQEEYRAKFKEYQKLSTAYNEARMRNQKKNNEYSLLMSDWHEQLDQELKDWTMLHDVEIPRTKTGKVAKGTRYKNWFESIEAQGFQYSDTPKPIKPIFEDCECPTFPKTSYKIPLADYELGAIAEVDEILNEAQPFFDKPCHTLTEEEFEAHEKKLLNQYWQTFLDGFSALIDHNDCTAKEVYSRLLQVEAMNWSEYGLRETYEGSRRYEPFGDWHKIHFDPKGMWLVEFESNSGTSCHLPYRIALEFGLIDSDSPLHNDSSPTEFEKVDQPLSQEECMRYPLIQLLISLGCTQEAFPYKLQEYEGYSLFRSFFNDDFIVT